MPIILSFLIVQTEIQLESYWRFIDDLLLNSEGFGILPWNMNFYPIIFNQVNTFLRVTAINISFLSPLMILQG